MGYQLVIGGTQSVSLATTQGWRDLKAWSESLDADRYPEIMQLTEHGISQDLDGLEAEVVGALEESPPIDMATESTIRGLIRSISNRSDRDAESAFVSDGLSDEGESPDDEWGGDCEHGTDPVAESDSDCQTHPGAAHKCAVKLSELSRFGRIAGEDRPLDPSSNHPPIIIAKSDSGRVDLLDGHHRTNGYFNWAEQNGKDPTTVGIPAIHVKDEGLANQIADASDRDKQSKAIATLNDSLVESYEEAKHHRDEHGRWSGSGSETDAHSFATKMNTILNQHDLPNVKVVKNSDDSHSAKLPGDDFEMTHENLEELKAAHAESREANKILQKHGHKPAVKVFDDSGAYAPTEDVEALRDADKDTTATNKILSNYGLKSHLEKDNNAGWVSSHSLEDARDMHREVSSANKGLFSLGLEPKVKIVEKGGQLHSSHNTDEINSALETLKKFRKGGLTESLGGLAILKEFGLQESIDLDLDAGGSAKPDGDWGEYP